MADISSFARKRIHDVEWQENIIWHKGCYDIPVDMDEFISFASSGISVFYKDVARVKFGADRLLASLKEKNIKLCLASATAMAEVKYALECHDLFKYFNFVLSCADIGAGKDKPDIYIKARNIMELPQEDICVFEDSYIALETAKKEGFQTVGIFDRYAFEQDRLKKVSDIYLDEHQSLDSLISLIHT